MNRQKTIDRQETIDWLKRLAGEPGDWTCPEYGEAVNSAIALLESDAIPGGFERGKIVQTNDGQQWRVVCYDSPYIVIYASLRCYEARLPGALTRVPPAPTVESIKAAAIAEIDRAAAEAKRKIQEVKP